VRRYWPLLIVTLLFAGAPRPASGCSCIAAAKPEEARSVPVVFSGVVTAVDRPFAIGIPCTPSSTDSVFAAFTVDTVYKGDLPVTVTVRSAAGGASCGYDFVAGKHYTVFATFGGSSLETSACGGNVEGAIAPSDYALPAGHAPRG
jgi:hypothetical protein